MIRLPEKIRRAKLFLAALAGLALLAGCGGDGAGNGRSELNSRFFSHVEVIGERGGGLGQFNKPRSVAVDGHDNLFVVDITGRVQKFSPQGAYLLSWQMPQTDIGKPKGMCEDGHGNIVIVEPHYSRVNFFNDAGKLLSQWGVSGTNAGQLGFPRSAAVTASGEIYLSEYGKAERIQEFSLDGKRLLSNFGRYGSEAGEFNRAEGMGLDAQGRLHVADSCNHRVQIFSPDGTFVTAFGKAGSGAGELSYPYDIRMDGQGNQYVCEFGNSRVQVFDAGNRSVEILGGPGSEPGKMSNPWSIAFDSKWNLYVADSDNHRVLKFVRKQTLPGQGARAGGKKGDAL
jgi:DNA-binding beta-propeller fold protein YncE